MSRKLGDCPRTTYEASGYCYQERVISVTSYTLNLGISLIALLFSIIGVILRLIYARVTRRHQKIRPHRGACALASTAFCYRCVRYKHQRIPSYTPSNERERDGYLQRTRGKMKASGCCCCSSTPGISFSLPLRD